MDVQVSLDTADWKRLEDALPGIGERWAMTMALLAEGFVKLRARVDTGFMRASVFIISRLANGQLGTSTRGQARTEARALAKRSFVENPSPDSSETLLVVGAEYGEFVEDKHPWFEPGVQAARGQGETVLQQLINQAGG